MTDRVEVVVVGASGLAREVLHLVSRCDLPVDVVAFVDKEDGGSLRGRPVVAEANAPMHLPAVIGIGDARVKHRLGSGPLRAMLFENAPPNLIHRGADFDPEVNSLGVGNVLCAGVIVTCDVTIGNHNLFNLGVTVGHDAVIEDFTTLNPGVNVSGGVVLAEGCLVGTGAQILEGVRVGRLARVGAGAVVTRDVEEGATVVGVPARPLGGRNGL